MTTEQYNALIAAVAGINKNQTELLAKFEELNKSHNNLGTYIEDNFERLHTQTEQLEGVMMMK